MVATCLPLLAVERTNPHQTDVDDIFCNIYECNAEYSARKKEEYRIWYETRQGGGGGWYRGFCPSRLLIMKKIEA
jgi:hypothetical protein